MQLSTMQPTATVSPTLCAVTSPPTVGDGADDLMAGDDRIARAAPVVAAGVEIAVADAGVGDLDRDIVGAQVAALEFHHLERLVGGVGAPSLG